MTQQDKTEEAPESIPAVSPDTYAKFKMRELFVIGCFIAGAAFTSGGLWMKLTWHEDNGHPIYTHDIAEIKERLIRIETLLKDK